MMPFDPALWTRLEQDGVPIWIRPDRPDWLVPNRSGDAVLSRLSVEVEKRNDTGSLSGSEAGIWNVAAGCPTARNTIGGRALTGGLLKGEPTFTVVSILYQSLALPSWSEPIRQQLCQYAR